jgi:hypothetical protein
LGYLINVHAKERKKLQEKKQPVRNKLALLNLTNCDTTIIKNVQSFAFSGDGKYVALKHYVPKGQKSKGASLIVRNLQTNRNFSIGNVAGYRWQKEGSLLAFIIDTEGKTGNGVQLFNGATGTLKVLDGKEALYMGLSWREKSDDLAAFRVEKNKNYEDSTHVILAWKQLASATPRASIFDQTKTTTFPANTRIVNTRSLVWSKDGKSLFFGIKKWLKKPARIDSIQIDSLKSDSNKTKLPKDAQKDEAPALQIWHSKDVRIIPEQQQRSERRREDTNLAIWHINNNKFVQLSDSLTEITRIQNDVPIVLGLNATPYEFNGMFGRPHFDAYAIDTQTGQKSKFLTRVRYVYSISPDAKSVVYLKDDDYHVYNFKSKQHQNLTQNLTASFVETDDDHPVEQKPPYGFVRWSKNSKSFFVRSKYNIWQLWADGSQKRNITEGEADKIIHRYVRLDPDEKYIDTQKPIYLSRFGEWSKKSGYASVIPGKKLKSHVWDDVYASRLTKAKDANTFAYTLERFDDSPDYFVSKGTLSKGEQISKTNPFQSNYAWGKSELIEYTNAEGRQLQGALFYPANSWGGYQAAYAVTQTDIFAASVAGAGLTNFISMYGMVFWSAGGVPETGHFEVSQERMIVPPWKDVEGYMRNSPVLNVEKLNTPLLFEVGDNDRNVDWRQGIEFYNAARRAGKQMVLLVYAKEGHGLREDKNRIDYHRRILKWFGHYLKGEPAEEWIEQGIPYLEQQRQLKNWEKK